MIHYLWAARAELVSGLRDPTGVAPAAGPESEWREVNDAFREVAASIDPALFVAVVDELAEKAAARVYASVEPFGDEQGLRTIVLAVDIANRGISIAADSSLWPTYGANFRLIMEQAERRLHAGRLFDALIFGMRGLQTALGGP